MGMQQRPIALVPLLGLLSLVGLGITTVRPQSDEGRVYRVAAVRRGLTRDPAAWVNRTVLVRGIAAAVACIFVGLVGFARMSGHWRTNLPQEIYAHLVAHANEVSHPM